MASLRHPNIVSARQAATGMALQLRPTATRRPHALPRATRPTPFLHSPSTPPSLFFRSRQVLFLGLTYSPPAIITGRQHWLGHCVCWGAGRPCHHAHSRRTPELPAPSTATLPSYHPRLHPLQSTAHAARSSIACGPPPSLPRRPRASPGRAASTWRSMQPRGCCACTRTPRRPFCTGAPPACWLLVRFLLAIGQVS